MEREMILELVVVEKLWITIMPLEILQIVFFFKMTNNSVKFVSKITILAMENVVLTESIGISKTWLVKAFLMIKGSLIVWLGVIMNLKSVLYVKFMMIEDLKKLRINLNPGFLLKKE